MLAFDFLGSSRVCASGLDYVSTALDHACQPVSPRKRVAAGRNHIAAYHARQRRLCSRMAAQYQASPFAPVKGNPGAQSVAGIGDDVAREDLKP
jgi:hypothetical protein